MGGSKCSCGKAISKFIGMKTPMAQVTAFASDGGEAEEEEDGWNVNEIENLSLGAGQGGKVVVIHLSQDNVAPLLQ
jgi:hypothetical protein